MSNIDPTVPLYGNATTQSVRDNFQHAYDEINALQTNTLPLSGGKMNGAITLPGNPTGSLDAVPKQYVDSQLAGGIVTKFNNRSGPVTLIQADVTAVNCLLTSGGIMTGTLTLNANPVNPSDAANKAYVDSMAGTGGSGSGVASFNNRTGVVTFLATDVSGVGGMMNTGGAFSGGINFGSSFAANAGDNTRHINLYATQYGINATANRLNYNTQVTHAFRVANADVVTIDTNGLNLPAAAPTSATQATNKSYVDTAVATKAPVANPVFSAGVFETRIAMAANNIDLNTGSVFTKTISGTTTLTVSNVPTTGTVASFILDLTNAGTNVTFWTNVKWPGGTAPILTAAGRDLLGFITYDAGATWNGMLLAKDIK